MIKYILAGTAATAVAVTVGVIVLKKDLACEYSPINLSSIVDCDAVQTQAVADAEPTTEDTTQNDDVSPTAGSQEIEQKTAEETTEADVAEIEQPELVAETATVPTFDIVRVEPDGSTLVAGRSAPNARIILRDGDENIGETTASDAGEWVIVVDEPLQSATATLSLLAMMPDGTSVESTATVNIALYKETPATQTADATTEQKPVIKLADTAGEKADDIIAKTEDAAKQAVAEVADATDAAVEKTVEQAEQLAKEAAALLKKAADRAAKAAEAASLIEKVEALPDVSEIAEQAIETVSEIVEPVIETAAKVTEEVSTEDTNEAVTEEITEATVETVIEPAAEVVAEAKVETAIEPVAEVVTEAAVEAVIEPVAEVVTEAAVETVIEPVAEVVTEAAVETVVEPVAEATVEAVTEPIAEVTAEAVTETTAKTTAEETPKVATETEEFIAKIPEVKTELAEKATPPETKVEPVQQDKTPLVVISEKGKATKILQGAGIGSKNNEMTFNSMDYNAKGEIIFSGDAKPSEMVRVYINNEFVGEAKADAAGRWSLDGGYVMQAGPNSLRFDQVDAGGNVISRRETKITMPKLAQMAKISEPETKETTTEAPQAVDSVEQAAIEEKTVQPVAQTIARKQVVAKTEQVALPDAEIIEVKGGGRAIIIWGDNLWNISRKIYGKGELYTTIFKANQDQIRNPNLIYPGQVFLLPDAVEIQ